MACREGHRGAEHVARRAGQRRDDRAVRAAQGVQQRALADVRSAHDGDAGYGHRRMPARKAAHALFSTKRHVNAVTDQMVGPMRSWSDADGLVTAFGDPECAVARKEYLRKRATRS